MGPKENLLAVARRCLQQGEFVFSSGIKSSFYLDCRLITTQPFGLFSVGKIVFVLVSGGDVRAVGGPATGAIPIVSAVVLESYRAQRPLSGFWVREATKSHGTQKLIEGNLETSWQVAVVEDVISSGGSVLRAIRVVEEQGCQVAKVVSLMDWQLGGSERLRQRGYDFVSVLTGEAKTGKIWISK
ncbi:MAG: orotate phosphoribosyltransferase [bacterium]